MTRAYCWEQQKLCAYDACLATSWCLVRNVPRSGPPVAYAWPWPNRAAVGSAVECGPGETRAPRDNGERPGEGERVRDKPSGSEGSG